MGGPDRIGPAAGLPPGATVAVPAGTAGPPGPTNAMMRVRERTRRSLPRATRVAVPATPSGPARTGANGPREDEPSGPGPSDPEASDPEASDRLDAAGRLGATITNQKRVAAGGTAGRRTSSLWNGPAPVQIAGGRGG